MTAAPEPRLGAKAAPISLWLLIAANAIPLVGVLLFGWSPFELLLLFWLETAVVGAFRIPRILLAQPASARGRASALPLVALLCVHFSGFMAVHLLFITILCGETAGGFGFGTAFDQAARMLRERPVQLALLGFVLSHGYSFFANYVGGREYAGAEPGRLVAQLYQRVLVMHFALIVGAAGVRVLGLPHPVLVVLVVLKTVLDARAHLREHRALEQTVTRA